MESPPSTPSTVSSGSWTGIAWNFTLSSPISLSAGATKRHSYGWNLESLPTGTAKGATEDLAMSRKDRIPTGGDQKTLSQNPFAVLSGAGLPAGKGGAPDPAPGVGAGAEKGGKNRGRVEVRRETSGRGGKTVTTVSGFTGIGLPEKEALAKRMQKACGTGGTVKEGAIEIQGDQREKIAAILADAGFRAVFAGG